MTHVGENYNRREVTLKVGEILEITLAENLTTGFQWLLTGRPEPVCELVSDESRGAAGSPGKGGVHLWEFRAVTRGDGAVELEYRRPWEKDAKPGKTFRLGVRVR